MQFSRQQTDEAAQRRARQFAALTELGFRPASEPLPVETLRAGDSWRVTQVVAAMGTRVSVLALARSRDRAEQAIGTAWQRMDELIGTLSRHDGASALSVLNDRGELRDAPAELVKVVAAAARMHRLSGGAFDATVLPVLELLESTAGQGAFEEPDAATMAGALARVDGAALRVDGRRIFLEREGARLTLDGIAKGYIVDALAAALQAEGVRSFLIDAGGDIRTAGDHAGRPWRVAVREPGEERSAELVQLHDGAVATSGSYEIAFDEQRTRHHLIGPRDGRSPQECASVTVRAPDAMSADALATTVFLLGPVAGLRLIDSIARAECLIVARDGSRHRSRGWADSLSRRREA